MIDAAGTNRYTYWPGGQLYTDDGPWSTDTITYSYNDARLPSGFNLQLVGGGTWTQSYTYDAGHRLEEVTSPAGTFEYSYDNGQTALPGSLVRKLTLPNTAYITNNYDLMGRLTNTSLLTSGQSLLFSIYF